MNNQSHMQPHYTLPGVMHYLQSEFTKNERDRIAWELERSEMKARIAQLEGENKDLHHEIMMLEAGHRPGSVKIVDTEKAASGDLTGLLKSKLAVQESVKEIIYLFKSPNVATQMHTLNGKGDAIHELQKLNLNQNLGDLQNAHSVSEMDLRQEIPRQVEREDDESLEISSDAGTVVMGSDGDSGEKEEPRRRRSSSLFTSVKVAPVETKKGDVDHSEDLAKISNLFQNNKDVSAAGIVQVKALGSQVLSYSHSESLKLLQVGPDLRVNKDTVRSFQGISATLIDFYWLDSKRFLVLDEQSITLYSVASEAPAASQHIPKNMEIKKSSLIGHDYTNSQFLFVFQNMIRILEVSNTLNTSPEKFSLGESFSIKGERSIVSAKFGMTEKSLIVFYSEPYEIVIYNYQGKVLQRIDVSRLLGAVTVEVGSSQLLLNKKSSKFMLLLSKRVLVYSFDQKKFVLNGSLENSPVGIIFKTIKDTAAFAYKNGTVEIRDLNDFNTVNQLPKSSEHSSQTSVMVNSVDSTVINSTPAVVFGHNDGTTTLRRLSELTEH